LLNLSLALFDGTHTIAKKGGGKVSYQGRKKNKTTNTLWLVDRQGMVVSFVPPLSGKHNDIFAIEKHLEIIVAQLKKSAISVDGLFLNADAGFDSKAFRAVCKRFRIIPNVPRNARRTKHLTDDDAYFDEQMYEERFVIERSNAWMDFNRTFLIRFDTSIESWVTWDFVAWLNFIRKITAFAKHILEFFHLFHSNFENPSKTKLLIAMQQRRHLALYFFNCPMDSFYCKSLNQFGY